MVHGKRKQASAVQSGFVARGGAGRGVVRLGRGQDARETGQAGSLDYDRGPGLADSLGYIPPEA